MIGIGVMRQHERASAGCERLILSEGSSCERETCGNNHLSHDEPPEGQLKRRLSSRQHRG
jgi:hypothetical protein